MSVIQSICIVCNKSRRFKSRLKENENMPFLLKRMWHVFVKYLHLDSTNNATSEQWDDILTFFNQVYEVPFCEQCRNDVAKLLVYHQKLKTATDSQPILLCIQRVVAKISSVIVTSNCNDTSTSPFQSHVKIEDQDDQAVEMAFINSLICRLRRYILQMYNPFVNISDCLLKNNVRIKSEPPETMDEDFDFNFEIDHEPDMQLEVEKDSKLGILKESNLEEGEIRNFKTEMTIDSQLSEDSKIMVLSTSDLKEVEDTILGILQGSDLLEVGEKSIRCFSTDVTCEICKRKLANNFSLRRHLLGVHRVKVMLYNEELCAKDIAIKQSSHTHNLTQIKLESNLAEDESNDMEIESGSYITVREESDPHMDVENDLNMEEPSHCSDLEFGSGNDLDVSEEEANTYSTKDVKCKLCKKVISSHHNLRRHLLNIHHVEMKVSRQLNAKDPVENQYSSPDMTHIESANDLVSESTRSRLGSIDQDQMLFRQKEREQKNKDLKSKKKKRGPRNKKVGCKNRKLGSKKENIKSKEKNLELKEKDLEPKDKNFESKEEYPIKISLPIDDKDLNITLINMGDDQFEYGGWRFSKSSLGYVCTCQTVFGDINNILIHISQRHLGVDYSKTRLILDSVKHVRDGRFSYKDRWFFTEVIKNCYVCQTCGNTIRTCNNMLTHIQARHSRKAIAPESGLVDESNNFGMEKGSDSSFKQDQYAHLLDLKSTFCSHCSTKFPHWTGLERHLKLKECEALNWRKVPNKKTGKSEIFYEGNWPVSWTDDDESSIFKCLTCNQTRNTKDDLALHIRMDHIYNSSIKCKFDDCKTTFSKASDLYLHYTRFHSPSKSADSTQPSSPDPSDKLLQSKVNPPALTDHKNPVENSSSAYPSILKTNVKDVVSPKGQSQSSTCSIKVKNLGYQVHEPPSKGLTLSQNKFFVICPVFRVFRISSQNQMTPGEQMTTAAENVKNKEASGGNQTNTDSPVAKKCKLNSSSSDVNTNDEVTKEIVKMDHNYCKTEGATES